MEPRLRELLEGNPDDEVRAIIRLRESLIPPPDIRIIAEFGDIATCRLLRSDISAVREHPACVSLKSPQPIEFDREIVDPSGLSGRVYDVQRPDVVETGRGVVVGIVDFAADFANPDFCIRDGAGIRTRFRSMYIMNDRGPQSGNNRFGRGRIFSRAEIDAALRTDSPYDALGYHPGRYVPEGASHGCHVMGIAASNGGASGIVGMAPDAEIVFCQPDSSDLEPRYLNFGDSVGILESCAHIVSEAGDTPTAINLSLGRHAGPHDGSTLVEQALDNLLRDTPGLVIANSGGNYYSERVHASGVLEPGERRTITWIVDDKDRSQDELEIWYDNADELEIELISPDGERFGPIARGDVIDITRDGVRTGRFYHREDREPGSQMHMANCFLGANSLPGRWRVRVHGAQIANGHFDAWIERNGGPDNQSRFARADADRLRTTGTIANAHKMIAVGAYDARDPARPLPFFSSGGPTLDGRDKPDILAPGVAVRSSASTPLNGDGPARAVKSGTSMAAPHVTGTAALMLQASEDRPGIDAIREALFSTADPVPHEHDRHRSGFGYLNPAAAIAHIKEVRLAAVAAEPDSTEVTMQQNPANPPAPVVDAGLTLADMAIEQTAFADDAKDDDLLIPGIRVSTDGRRVIVDISERGNPDIETLAGTLHLPPRRVFSILLRNRAVVRYLWQNEIYNDAEQPAWRGIAAARRALRNQGLQTVARTKSERGPIVTTPIFYNYSLESDFPGSVTFPLSPGLRRRLAELQARRERERRRRALVPVTARVRKALDRMRIEAGVLRNYMEAIGRVLAEPVKEVALLEMLLGILNAMLHPKSSRRQPASRLKRARRLKSLVEDLKHKAHRHMLLERPNLASQRAKRDRRAARLLALLEDAAFLRDLRTVVADAELVPGDDIEKIYGGLRTAYSALMASPLAERILASHVLPFIDQLASADLDYSGIKTRVNPALATAVRQAPTAGSPTTALTIAGELFLKTPDIVGNTPGPDSLAVAMLETAAPMLMQQIMTRAMRNGANVSRLSARLYRALCTAARLDRAQRVALLEAVDAGDLSQIRKINWSRSFQNSVGFGSIITVVSLIALINAIRSDDASSVRRWADIIGSLSGVITGASTVARSLTLTSALMRNGMVAAGAKAVGVIGGIAAVVSGVAEASERHERGDSTGMWLAVGGSIGGAMTVGGFLIGLGAGTSATIAGAPIGAVLAVAGVVISLGAAIWSLVRDWRTTSGHRLFEAVLEHFGRKGGDFRFISRQVPALPSAFRRVQTAHHDTRFWDAHFDLVPQLADLGFRDSDIALITNKNAVKVVAVLSQKRPERYRKSGARSTDARSEPEALEHLQPAGAFA